MKIVERPLYITTAVFSTIRQIKHLSQGYLAFPTALSQYRIAAGRIILPGSRSNCIVFGSVSDDVRFYVKEFLEDTQLHSRKEVWEYVKARMTTEFRESHFAYAIRSASREAGYEMPCRGYIQKQPDVPCCEAMQERLIRILEGSNEKLLQVCAVHMLHEQEDALELTDEPFPV